MSSDGLRAPFPWFGGKSKVASVIWDALGDPANYVEPFAGTAAVLLARPNVGKVETINDKDGFVANFWRAVSCDPDAVAHYADWPVNECDLEARHAWLITRKERLRWSLEDADFYDAKIAGWWVWGICSWIAQGFTSGDGPWKHDGAHFFKLPHLGDAGRGINRKLPHLGDAGMGINRQLPHLGNAGRGEFIREWMWALADRLREVRVACGDWKRILGPSSTVKHGVTGVFLDPPYQCDKRSSVYSEEDFSVGNDVAKWAIEHGTDPTLRIVYAGYEGTAVFDGWRCVEWKTRGGFGSQRKDGTNANAKRERLWLSPHCIAEDSLLTLDASA